MDTRGKSRAAFCHPPHFNVLRILKVPLYRRWYQGILTLAQETTCQGNKQQMVWKVLDEWVNKKISTVVVVAPQLGCRINAFNLIGRKRRTGDGGIF